MAETASTKPSRGFGFRAIPRKVRWIVYANSFGSVGFGFLMVFISAYLPQSGMSADIVGLILGAEGAAMVIAAIPLGMFSDRRGRKGLLIVGSAILPPAMLVFAFTRDTLPLVLASVVAGVAEGGLLSSWNAIIADQTTPEQRSAAFSLSFVIGNLTVGFGFVLPLFFPYLEAWTGLGTDAMHRWVLLVTVSAGLLTPVANVILLRGYRETLRPKSARTKGMDWKPLLKFSGLNGLIGLGAGFFVPLVAVWLFLKFTVLDTWSGPVLAVSNMTIGVAALVSPLLAKRYGSIRAIVMVQSLSTAFLLSLAFLGDPITAAGFYIVRAALMNMSSPISDSFLMGIVEPEQRGLASAVNSIIWRLPNSITTILGGILMKAGYLDVPIFLATLFYVASISGMYAVFRNVRPKD